MLGGAEQFGVSSAGTRPQRLLSCTEPVCVCVCVCVCVSAGGIAGAQINLEEFVVSFLARLLALLKIRDKESTRPPITIKDRSGIKR